MELFTKPFYMLMAGSVSSKFCKLQTSKSKHASLIDNLREKNLSRKLSLCRFAFLYPQIAMTNNDNCKSFASLV